MKKRIFTAMLAVLLLVPMLASTVSADMGPKPSTIITVPGNDEQIVLTLLSDREHYGPNSPVEAGEKPSARIEKDAALAEAWYAFRDHRDPDGFVFWGDVWEGGVSWTYYPPETFKIAVYYPERDLLWVSRESYDRYAFRSHYRLVLPAVGEGAVSGQVDMVLKQETSMAGELGGLVLRIVLTIAIELALAGFFGFSSREQRRLILLVNLVTQVGLNGLLWSWYYFDGIMMAMLRLFLAELLVLIVETVIYLRRLREGESIGRTVLYTLCANGASVLAGFLFLS